MPEPKKHPGGRPRKFKSVAEMSTAIDAYFAACDARVVDFVTSRGIVVRIAKPMPYTMSGLANALGMDRRSLVNYTERSDEYGVDFFPTITQARAKVQQDMEDRLYDGQGSDRGLIFGLKNNYAWKEAPVEVTGAGGGPLVIVRGPSEPPE